MGYEVEAGSVSARDAALEGWGTPVGGVLRVGGLLARWRREDDDPAHGIHRARFLERGAGGRAASPLPAGVGAFAYDMLRRAAACEDGNAFYGRYDPELAAALHARYGGGRPTDGDDAHDDMSLQYDVEAGQAARVMDGLNLVPDDLVAVALLGRSGRGLSPDPATAVGAEAAGIAALARVAARALLDADDVDAARRRTALLVAELTRLVEATLAAPEGRIAEGRIGVSEDEAAALSRYADQRGEGWRQDLRWWTRLGFEPRHHVPLHAPDAPVLRGLLERLRPEDVKWLVAGRLALGEGDEVSTIVFQGGEAWLVPGPDGALGAIPGEATPGSTPREVSAATIARMLWEGAERGSTRLAARLLEPDGRWRHVYVARVDDGFDPLEVDVVGVPTFVDGRDVFRAARNGVRLDATLRALGEAETFRSATYEMARDDGPHDGAGQVEMEATIEGLAASLGIANRR